MGACFRGYLQKFINRLLLLDSRLYSLVGGFYERGLFAKLIIRWFILEGQAAEVNSQIGNYMYERGFC